MAIKVNSKPFQASEMELLRNLLPATKMNSKSFKTSKVEFIAKIVKI